MELGRVSLVLLIGLHVCVGADKQQMLSCPVRFAELDVNSLQTAAERLLNATDEKNPAAGPFSCALLLQAISQPTINRECNLFRVFPLSKRLASVLSIPASRLIFGASSSNSTSHSLIPNLVRTRPRKPIFVRKRDDVPQDQGVLKRVTGDRPESYLRADNLLDSFFHVVPVAVNRSRAAEDIAARTSELLLVREEVCIRKVRSDISTGLSSAVLAQTIEGSMETTQGFLDIIWDAIGAPILETLGYIIGLMLVAFLGLDFLNKMVAAITKMLPGAIDLVLVPIVSDMTIQTITRGVVYAVCDGSVPQIIATMRVQIMASLAAYCATTVGPMLQHRITHQASQALIRDTSRKVTHTVVEGLTHSVTHVALHKVIHQFMCIYCFYHGQYCERCFYYGETIPLLQTSGTEPQSFGPMGTSESGAIADAYNFVTHALPLNAAPTGPEKNMETKSREELIEHEMANPDPSVKNDPMDSGMAVTLSTN